MDFAKVAEGPMMKTFDRYRCNVHSQNGEDGVIGEISSTCVEFGAWLTPRSIARQAFHRVEWLVHQSHHDPQ